MGNQRRLICTGCNEELEFKYDEYYLEHRGEIELVKDVPQYVCNACEYIAVLNEEIEKMHRYIDQYLFLANLCGGYDDEQ